MYVYINYCNTVHYVRVVYSVLSYQLRQWLAVTGQSIRFVAVTTDLNKSTLVQNPQRAALA